MDWKEKDGDVKIRIRKSTHRQLHELCNIDHRNYLIDEIAYIVEKYYYEHPEVSVVLK